MEATRKEPRIADRVRQWILDSVACCACPPGDDAENGIRTGLADARWICQHHGVIPLPILLDFGSLSACPGSCRPRPCDVGSPPPPLVTSYDGWIHRVASDFLEIRGRLDSHPLPFLMKVAAPLWVPLASLLKRVDSSLPEMNRGMSGVLSAHLYQAYDALSKDWAGIRDLVERWKRPRTHVESAWTPWWPSEIPCQSQIRSDPMLLWGQYRSVMESLHLHESLDHHAAWMRQNRTPAIFSGSLSPRVQFRRRGRPSLDPTARPGSPDEESSSGRIQWPTLALGEYGEFQIVQHADLRLSESHLSARVHPPTVHVGWMVDRPALSHQVMVDMSPRKERREVGQTPYAIRISSILLGLAHLLADDLSEAFRTSHIPCLIHRIHPLPFQWDLSDTRLGDPRAHMEALRRVSITDLLDENQEHENPSKATAMKIDGEDLWCVCVYAKDLEGWGFSSPKDLQGGLAIGPRRWRRKESGRVFSIGHLRLSPRTENALIVLDEGTARLCQIVQERDELTVSEWPETVEDFQESRLSFAKVRGHLLRWISSHMGRR